MTRIIQFPEYNIDGFKVVQYGAQDTVVYDSLVDERQAVWNDVDLDDGKRFVETLRPYLVAYVANQVELTKESHAALSAAYDGLPSVYQAQARKIAVARYGA